MNFCDSFPIVHYNSSDFKVNAKLKIHSTANFENVSNIKSSGRNVIEENVVLHSEMGIVIMDQDTLLQKGVQIYPSTLYINQEGEVSTRESPHIVIGKNVIIGENSVIRANRIGTNVYIGKNCVIEEGCIIKDNVVIENDSVLSSYSVVAPFSQMGGNPCVFHHELPYSFHYQMKRYCSSIFDNYVSYDVF